MTTATDSKDAKLTAACIEVLRRIDTPLSCVALSRLCHADPSTIFRLLSHHPQVKTVRSQGATVFSLVKS